MNILIIDCSVNDCHYDSWHALHPQKAKPKKGFDFNTSSPSLIKSCSARMEIKTFRYLEPDHASCYVGLQMRKENQAEYHGKLVTVKI